MNPIEATTETGVRVVITPTEGLNLPSTLSELASAFKSISPPSNAQIESALEGAKEVIHEEMTHLSSKGKVLAKDAENLIDSTTTLLHERNKNDKLQKLVEVGSEVIPPVAEAAKNQGKKLVEGAFSQGKELAEGASEKLSGLGKLTGQAASEAEDVFSYIRHMAYNFIRSSDFRDIANDWVKFLQQLSSEKIKKQMKKKRKLTHGTKGEKEEEKAEGKPLSEEDLLEQIQQSFGELVNKMSKSKDYQKAVREFYKLTDEVLGQLGDSKEKLSESAQIFWRVLDETTDIVSEFTGRAEMRKFKEGLSDMYTDVVEDKKLGPWLKDLKDYLLEAINVPDSINKDKLKNKAADMIKKGRAILSQAKWRRLFEPLTSLFNSMVEKLKSDTVINDFGQKLQQFGKDLTLNDKGYPDLFVVEESINQMKNLLIPLFRKQLDNLPIKKIEIFSDTYDATLEDMIAVGSGFLPEAMDIHMRNDSHMDFKNEGQDMMSHQLEIVVENIKPEFKNMKFHYKRKSFPTIEDFGMADLTFTGNGATIRVVWKIESQSGHYPVATLEDASCEIDGLNIRIVGEATKHEILDTLLAPFVAGVLKNKLAKVIEEYLRTQLGSINEQLNAFFASRPTQMLKEKASQAMIDTINKYQQSIQRV
jgi:flagellin-specific chaperone FliS